MAALAAAVGPFVAGVPRQAEPVPSDARERASGMKRPRVGVAPARASSGCLTKMSRSCNSVVTAAGMEQVLPVGGELLQKRMVSELDTLRGVLKKAELVSRGGGACKGGAPVAGKKEWFLASNQRVKPIEEDCNAPSAKKRKMSTPVEQMKQIPAPRRMKVDEESKDDKVAEESKGKKEEEYADISGGLSHSSGDSVTKVAQQSTEAWKVQDAQQRAAPKAAVDMRALLNRANLRRQQLEIERAVQPDQSIDPRELQRLAVLASRSVAIRASCVSSRSSSSSTRR